MAKPRPYIPDIGKAVVKNVAVPDGRPVINLSLNESSFGVSPLAAEAAQQRCERLYRYPDPASTDLRAVIGARFGLDADRIVCGNGSEELLDLIGRLYARPGDEILFAEHAFLAFSIVAMRVGATPVRAPAPGFTTDVDALLERVTDNTRVVFLDNPNNPCGTYIPAGEVKRLRDGLPDHVVLVIDSAYAEYVDKPDYTDGLEFVAGSENVIVTRTFSKAYGLAALRIGWGYCSASMAGVINRMRAIGNVNAVAQAAVAGALEDQDFVRGVRDATNRERQKLTDVFTAMGLAVTPSVTNFLIVRFPDTGNHRAGAAYAHLIRNGIIVREVTDYGLDDYLRFTIGRPEENDAVIEALSRFMV